ncbi:Myb-like transcription factor family protein, putative isoform 2 [Hibiscus syriacus]|uniref:Myb-like transcription factor family protein, putative isoform 2 n=1 Tax=Hibiscus syriacus TaxID=106335 RepID=A0A6A2XVN2_HIBSY|nr:transcription factor HHO2-like [Hibiscus syriacus]KAE8666086.1 Myb-like transcription factor family protein, putative isoform 2 [Hibiscus syriacus]
MVEMGLAQKMLRDHEYVEALEEERRKIQVFQRELPLCLELVTKAIEACKKEISGGSTTTDYMQRKWDCSEQTTSDVPVLEEFIPIKKNYDCFEEDDEQESHKSEEKNVPAAVDHKRKSDWLRSVQLWNDNNNNQSPDLSLNEDAGNNGSGVEVKENGGAFQRFQGEKTVEKSVQSSAVGKANASATSTSTTESSRGGGKANSGNSSKKDEKEGQTQRKIRRCWSPELHRRFLHALQQLGGSHAATPKQIRELMKVDGLTNNEVKSHLQKYRLHTRRPSPSVQHNANPQAPQFVVVGGIWVPPPEYLTTSTKTSTIAPTSGIYAPVATLPSLAQPCGR